MPTIIGLDHGNGWVKVRSSDKQVVLPSFFALKSTLGEDSLNQTKLDLNEFESSMDKGNVYIWGNDISQVPSEERIPTYGMQDRYKQLKYKLLSEFAIATVLGDEDTYNDVWIVTGVPSKEKDTETEKQLEEALLGGHLLKVNGEDKIIKITKVVILAQPIGTVLSMYLDEDGYVLDDKYEESLVGVLDIGSGTTDIDTVKNLRRNSKSDSIPMGMHDVHHEIADYLNKKNPNLNVSVQDVEKQFPNTQYEISKRKDPIDISSPSQAAVKNLSQKIINKLTQQWKTWDLFDEVIVTGGGAESVQEHLKELIPDVNVVSHSQFANAEGFYRYGQFLKEE